MVNLPYIFHRVAVLQLPDDLGTCSLLQVHSRSKFGADLFERNRMMCQSSPSSSNFEYKQPLDFHLQLGRGR